MGTFVLMALLAIPNPPATPRESAFATVDNQTIEETVDVIELHRCFDFRGKVAFQQLIFYKWSRYHRRFQVIDTVVVTTPSMVPRRSRNGFFRASWHDGSNRRIVQALTFRKTASNSDPEVPERQYVPVELRRGLKQTDEPIAAPSTRTAAIIRPERLLKY